MSNITSNFQLSQHQIEKIKSWEKGEIVDSEKEGQSQQEEEVKLEMQRRVQTGLQNKQIQESNIRRQQTEQLVKQYKEQEKQKRYQKANSMCGIAGMTCKKAFTGMIPMSVGSKKVQRNEGRSVGG